MKKFLSSCFINIIFIIIIIYIFVYSNDINESISFVINAWQNNLVPSIFPFLLFSNLLMDYGFVSLISAIFGNIFSFVFRLPKKGSFAFIGSIFTGFPTGAKYVVDLLNAKCISIDDANRLLTFTSYSNPIFVISVVGESLLRSKEIGILLFVTHLITGIFIGIIFRIGKNRNNSVSNFYITGSNSFSESLIKSINNSFSILLNMLGIIIFFTIIADVIDSILPYNIISYIFKGVLEVTSSIIAVSKSSLSFKLKYSLIGSFLSFNGLSVHFQIKSIINGTGIEYSRFLYARILHALLCFMFLYFIF